MKDVTWTGFDLKKQRIIKTQIATHDKEFHS